MEKLIYVDRRIQIVISGMDSTRCSEKKGCMRCGWQIWISVYQNASLKP